jgi:hypothetical protein
MVIQSINKPKDFAVIFKVLILIAVILSIEGICEYVFNYTLWVDKGRRASATFLDPNIFARFLDIIIVMLLILRIIKKIIIILIFLFLFLLKTNLKMSIFLGSMSISKTSNNSVLYFFFSVLI